MSITSNPSPADVRRTITPPDPQKKSRFDGPTAPVTSTSEGEHVVERRAVEIPDRGEPWPAPIHEDAFHGLAGEIVDALDPATEADRVGVLVNVLAAFGNIVGPTPHWSVSGARHGLRINPILVGPTGHARKGTAWSTASWFLGQAAPEWTKHNIASGGLSTGEGLIHAVRDAKYKERPVRASDEAPAGTDTIKVLDEEGVDDKRLFIVEEEFARVLNVMRRDASILSPIIRQAWDHGDMRVMTKTSPYQATNAHLTITGHITEDELRDRLTQVDGTNGFANRFLWVSVRRSKYLPSGGRLSADLIAPVALQLREAIAGAKSVSEIRRTSDAEAMWREMYVHLTRSRAGMASGLLGRGESHVMRLACIYALLNTSNVVTPQHLGAAAALWEYSERSVAHIFGGEHGSPLEARLLAMLQDNGSMTRTQIRDALNRNYPVKEVDEALDALSLAGKIASMKRSNTGGRPATIWTLAETP